LKNSQIEKKKFRRQHSVGPYVLDFYCPSERLCIELDGAGHFTDGGYEYDTARTEYLDAHDIFVIRFENKDVFENTEGVLEEIRRILLLNKHPSPLNQGGEFFETPGSPAPPD
jgi:very-short-patch-repair endonuclease